MTERDEHWLSRTLTGDDPTHPTHPASTDAGDLLAGVHRRRRAARRRRRTVVAGAAAVVVAVAGVVAVTGGDDAELIQVQRDPAAGFPTAATPYDGPLADVDERYGAAGRVLDCPVVEGGAEPEEPYGSGATADSVEGAVETAYSEGLFLSLPRLDLAVAASEPDRVLLTYAPAGPTVAALVLHDGPATEGAGGPGWHLDAWARCDLSRFPARDAAALGYQVWRDDGGSPVPVTTLSSGPGPEHCGWERFTFLHLDDGRVYFVRRPDRTLRDLVRGTYREDVSLPPDAVATGYRRDGRRLWRTPGDRVVYVGTADRVEVWPRFVGGCA